MLLPPRAELSLACGEQLAVHRFSIREALSSLFELRVLARSPDPCLDLRPLVGQPAALRLASATQHALHERRWAGICNQARVPGQGGGPGGASIALASTDAAVTLTACTLTAGNGGHGGAGGPGGNNNLAMNSGAEGRGTTEEEWP